MPTVLRAGGYIFFFYSNVDRAKAVISLLFRALLVIPVLACLFVLSGCGGFSGPTTSIQAMGDIQATLPGTDWQKLSSKPADTNDSEMYVNGDGTLVFEVSSGSLSDVRVPDFVTLPGGATPEPVKYPSSSSTTMIQYHNYKITRIESASPHSSVYHMVAYVFKTDDGGRLYVGAGSTNDRWNKDGKDIVPTILDEVKIKLVPDISDIP